MRLLVRHSIYRYLREPVSVRNAMRAIVAATLFNVIVGGILIRIADPNQFPDIGAGFWWALQTVTTVGYGDVTPKSVLGRLIGAAVMLYAIAFMAVVTAVITSTFVERSRMEHQHLEAAAESASERRFMARLDEITERLARIEQTLEQRHAQPEVKQMSVEGADSPTGETLG